jgi:type IV secretion system protein VirB10
VRNNNEVTGSAGEERGIPGTTTRKKTRMGSVAVFGAAVILILVAIAFAIVAINRFTAQKMLEKAAAHKADADKLANSGGPASDLTAEKNKIKQDEDRAALEAAAQAAAASAAAAQANANLPPPAGARQPSGQPGSNQQGASAAEAGMTPQQMERQRLDQRQESGDVIFASSDAKASGPSNGVQETIAALTAAAKSGQSTNAPTSSKKNALEEQLVPSTLDAGQASLLPNLDYLLKRGTTIRCGVITKIVSTWPGAVTCTVLEDVYSANHHTLLIRAGAVAFGEARNALIQGQARIPVLWDEIDDGKVAITINSPAADSLGGAGIDAYVDNHFWLRFGGASMVSLIGDFGQAAANRTIGGGQSQVSLSNSGNTADSAAAEALKSTIDIPPTAYTNQGDVTNIFIARHIDMSSVYKVIKDERNDDVASE